MKGSKGYPLPNPPMNSSSTNWGAKKAGKIKHNPKSGALEVGRNMKGK